MNWLNHFIKNFKILSYKIFIKKSKKILSCNFSLVTFFPLPPLQTYQEYPNNFSNLLWCKKVHPQKSKTFGWNISINSQIQRASFIICCIQRIIAYSILQIDELGNKELFWSGTCMCPGQKRENKCYGLIFVFQVTQHTGNFTHIIIFMA